MEDHDEGAARPAPNATADAARRALQMKTAAAGAAQPGVKRGRVGDERAAAAHSASRSKPALRK